MENLKYIFIVGVPRSGTTVITKHLCQFNNVSYIPRSYRLLEKLDIHQSSFLGKLIANLSNKYRNLKLRLHEHDGGNLVWNKFYSVNNKFEQKKFIDRISFNPTNNTKCIFINKRIANVNFLNELSSVFKDSTLIHIKRDPIDTIISILNRRKKLFGTMEKRWGVFPDNMPEKNNNPIIDCTLQYMKIYELIEESKFLFKNYTEINYSEFCSNPDKILTSIAQEINLTGSIPSTNQIKLRNNISSKEIIENVKNIFANSNNTDLIQYSLNL
jgi:hypothetical protein